MFRRAPLALVNRTPACAHRHARTKHVNTWTVTCTHATCAAVEACTLGRYLVLPTVSHTCTLSMASCSAVMVAGLQGWCCVSVQRGISGYRRQHSGAWHVSHPLITPVVCTNTYSTYLITAQHVTRAGSKQHTNETATESRFTNIDGKARMRNHTQMQRVPEPQLQSAKMISHHH